MGLKPDGDGILALEGLHRNRNLLVHELALSRIAQRFGCHGLAVHQNIELPRALLAPPECQPQDQRAGFIRDLETIAEPAAVFRVPPVAAHFPSVGSGTASGAESLKPVFLLGEFVTDDHPVHRPLVQLRLGLGLALQLVVFQSQAFGSDPLPVDRIPLEMVLEERHEAHFATIEPPGAEMKRLAGHGPE